MLNGSCFQGLGKEAEFCGAKVMLFACVNEKHDYGKRVYCGREWCPRCGLYGSNMHTRRYMRIMGKVWALSMGKKGLSYLVLTMPQELRRFCTSKQVLGSLKREVIKLLKADYKAHQGIVRWHYFGDGKIREGKLNLGKYHPHLNAIIHGRWFEENQLEALRGKWRQILCNVLKIKYQGPVVVYHGYAGQPGKWFHRAKYITRATFLRLDGWEALAQNLYNFRNITMWGWSVPTGQSLEAQGWIEYRKWANDRLSVPRDERELSLNRGQCPECSAKLYKYAIKDMKELQKEYEIKQSFEKTGWVILNKKPSSYGTDDWGRTQQEAQPKKLGLYSFCKKCHKQHDVLEPCIRA